MKDTDNAEDSAKKLPFVDAARPKESAVPGVIETFVSRIRAIRNCATEHIAFAARSDVAFLKKLSDLATTDESGQTVLTFRDGEHLCEMIARAASSHSAILSQSLLIFAFSTFDAYAGILLKTLYREVPTLIFKLEEKEVKVADLLRCSDLDEAVDGIIEKDISNLLRTSYEQQFNTLANRHGVSTLKKFDEWPDFIEASQRRNLVTHCNGIVNSEYLRACKVAGCSVDKNVTVGHRLKVDDRYLRKTLDLLYEVGVILGHTLWRTADTSRIEDSERVLTDEVYSLLLREEWHLAKRIGSFAIGLPNQKRDLYVRICRINYAQALKWSGDNAGAMKILDAVDWSSSIRDLRLGVEVLRENFDEAASLMKEIGKKGELIRKIGYRDWPVFREFRETKQFQDAYSEVYGTPFVGGDKTGSPKEDENEPTLPGDTASDSIEEKGDLSMPSTPPPDEDSDETTRDPGAE